MGTTTLRDGTNLTPGEQGLYDRAVAAKEKLNAFRTTDRGPEVEAASKAFFDARAALWAFEDSMGLARVLF